VSVAGKGAPKGRAKAEARAAKVEARIKRPRLMKEAIAFQDDLEEIIASTPPRMIRTTQYLVVALIVLLLCVAGLSNVEMVVVGTGQLVTDEPPIVLQPLERSIIRELKVKAGDVVTKGQVLARLDPTFVQADMTSLSAQERALSAQTRRLQAELEGMDYNIVNPADPDESLQSILHGQRMQEYASRLRAFDEEIQRYESNMSATESDRDLLGKQLEVAKDVENMRAILMRSQTGSKLQYLDSASVRMRTQRDYLTAVNKLTELQHYLDAKRAERQGYIDEWRRELLEDLVKIRAQENQVQENLSKAQRMHDLIEIVAPEDGVVLDIAKRSVGSVLREAEPLVSLVPSRAKLIAEIKINSADVGYLKTGEETVIKVDAFPYQRHGLMEGRLRSISEESFLAGEQSDQNGTLPPARAPNTAFHRGQVELTKTKLAHMPDGARLIPGMTLTAEIKVGSRSILSYFLYPITRGFDEIIREP
jgi:HlyD family secretion protein